MSAFDSDIISRCSDSAVMVRVTGRDTTGARTSGRSFFKRDGSDVSISSSGIIIDRASNICLTTATLLVPFFQSDSSDTLLAGTNIEILLSNISDNSTQSNLWQKAKIIRFLRSSNLKLLMERFKRGSEWIVGWPQFAKDTGTISEQSKLYETLKSRYEDLVLLQIEPSVGPLYSTPTLTNTSVSPSKYPKRRDINIHLDFNVVDPSSIEKGQLLTYIGSPYGVIYPSVFHNCVYSAMVSNIVYEETSESSSHIQQQGCFLIIDHNVFPGCEGSPVFDRTGSLVGFIAPPLLRTDGSNVEVHLVLPAFHFFYELNQSILNLGKKKPKHSPILDKLIRSKPIDFHLVQMAISRANQFRSRIKSSILNHPSQSSFNPSYPNTPSSSTSISTPTTININFPNSYNSSLYTDPFVTMNNSILEAAKAIVLVSIGPNWGSGILVSPQGHILTAGHVVKDHILENTLPYRPKLKNGYKLNIRIDETSSLQSDQQLSKNGAKTNEEKNTTSSRHRWYQASVIYLPRSHWDLALLQIHIDQEHTALPREEFPFLNLVPSRTPYKALAEGQSIVSIGFSLFGPSKRVKCTITSGIISKLIYSNGRTVLIQTNSSVNKGASGGAIVDAETGQLISLIESNSKTEEGIITPKLNFSIPYNICEPIDAFIQTGEQQKLDALEIPDPECEAIYSLSNYVPPTPPLKQTQGGSPLFNDYLKKFMNIQDQSKL